MENDITNIRYVEMTYDHTITFDIDEIANANNFLTRDIEEVECGKWAKLKITLKDGRVIEEDGCFYNSTPELKWADREAFYDGSYNELI